MGRSFRLRLPLQLQDMASDALAPGGDGFADEAGALTGQSRGDLRPILRLQRLDRGRKEVALFHGHVTTFLLDEVANDVIDGLSLEFPIGQDRSEEHTSELQS